MMKNNIFCVFLLFVVFLFSSCAQDLRPLSDLQKQLYLEEAEHVIPNLIPFELKKKIFAFTVIDTFANGGEMKSSKRFFDQSQKLLVSYPFMMIKKNREEKFSRKYVYYDFVEECLSIEISYIPPEFITMKVESKLTVNNYMVQFSVENGEGSYLLYNNDQILDKGFFNFMSKNKKII